MSATGNNTFERIQREIKESLEREDELKNEYAKITNNNNVNTTNGYVKNTDYEKETKATSVVTNGTPTGATKTNGFRRFTPNNGTRGVMQKFLKMKGKLTLTSVKPTSQSETTWSIDTLQPARITTENGKPPRNGFVSADEKIKKELQEFQTREAELRHERRKSQPNLMACLDLDEENIKPVVFNSSLKSAKSMANIPSMEDDYVYRDENESTASSSLKPARSLASLCDLSDDDLGSSRTHDLIKQFESLKTEQVHF